MFKNNQNRNNYGNSQKGNNSYKKGNGKVQLTIDNSEKYINPYNFITLPKTCERKPENERKGNLNGYIECTLIAKTPIIVPDTQNVGIEKIKEDHNHNKFKFFNYGEKSPSGFIKPVISGSEIRGMLRSDYEVFTDSCMSTLSKDITFISRANKAKLPGILKKEENEVEDENGNKHKEIHWALYKATRYALHTCRKENNSGQPRPLSGNNEAIYMVDKENRITIDGKKLKTGDKVKFKFKPTHASILPDIVLEVGKGDKEGILFIGETGGKKVGNSIHDSIFVETNEKLQVESLDFEVEKLKAIFEMYNDEAFNQKIRNSNKQWYAGYDIENAKILPVWYSKVENNRTYLSLAAIGKEAYYRTIQELAGEFMPCTDRNKICNTCNLFGFVSDDDASSSKIRISDAIYEGEVNPYENEMTIKELASPHIANAAFYALYTPNSGFENMPKTFDFNYDVKIDKDGKKAIDNKDISIRGRKQYWHHSDIKNALTTEKTKRNCSIVPVKIGTEFKFKIYFNNINKQNLNELISVINLEYEKDLDLCHKIGKGKPLGFGSCKLKVDNVYLKDIKFENDKLTYRMKKYNDFFASDNSKLENVSLKEFNNMDTIPMKEALRIYDFNYISKNYPEARVQYPVGKSNNKEAGYSWFTLNKGTGFKNSYLLMVLPRIIDGKDENGEEGFKGLKDKEWLEIKQKYGDENGEDKDKISIHGLLLPKYKK